MPKNKGIKSPNNSSDIAVFLITLVVLVIMSSFVISFVSKSKMQNSEDSLQNEISALKSQIALVQNNDKTDKPVVGPKADLAPAQNEFDPNTEVKFTKCGVAGAFRLEDWYPAFTDKIKTMNFVPKNVTSACYSDSGNMLIFIAQSGTYCEGPKVYRYNMKTSNLRLADVLNKGVTCLGSLKEFGKRTGSVITAVAPGGDGGCRREEYYNYDFIKNTVELVKSRSLCEGDSEWKWTEY